MSISALEKKILYLERKQSYIEDKLKLYENASHPLFKTLPVKIYDTVPLYNLKTDNIFFLMVLIIRKNSKRCPIIKISKDVLCEIAYSKKDRNVTILDYVHTQRFAEKTIIGNEWKWIIR